MKSPGPTRLAPVSSRYRYAPRKTTTNTSAVCVCIPASNPGRNFVNPPNGPLTVSPQATELETPGTSGEHLTARERAKHDHGSGVISARSRADKYSPLVPGASSSLAWVDTVKVPFGGLQKLTPRF